MRAAVEQAPTIGEMQRSPKAEKLWNVIYHHIPDPGGLLGAVTARAEAQLLRLSVVYALLDRSPSIDVEPLLAAWTVWQYCEASAQHIFGTILGDPAADRLLAELRTVYPKGLDGTEQSALFSRHVGHAQLQAARERLEHQGLVKTNKESTGGKPRLVSLAVLKKHGA